MLLSGCRDFSRVCELVAKIFGGVARISRGGYSGCVLCHSLAPSFTFHYVIVDSIVSRTLRVRAHTYPLYLHHN